MFVYSWSIGLTRHLYSTYNNKSKQLYFDNISTRIYLFVWYRPVSIRNMKIVWKRMTRSFGNSILTLVRKQITFWNSKSQVSRYTKPTVSLCFFSRRNTRLWWIDNSKNFILLTQQYKLLCLNHYIEPIRVEYPKWTLLWISVICLLKR